jgi:hypothetical protein
MAARRLKPPPTLLKPKEISALYDALETTQRCLEHHGMCISTSNSKDNLSPFYQSSINTQTSQSIDAE